MIRFFTRAEKIIAVLLVLLIVGTGYYLTRRFVWDNSLQVPGEGGIHTEGLVGKVQYLNPILSASNPVDRDISQLIYSGLTRFNPHTGLIEDDIATSEKANDNMVYRFTILPDAKWHDGESVMADDVIFTYRDVLKSEIFQQNPYAQPFKDVTVNKLTERTVEFRLSKPYSFFLANVTLGILPKHILKDIPVENLSKSEFNQQPIGTGPFRFVSWVQNSDTTEVTLKRSEEYYGTQAKLETVLFRVFPDQNALYTAENTLNGFRVLTQDPNSFVADSRRFQLYPYVLPQYTALFLNTESEILSNKKVRFALLLATNKDEVLESTPESEIVDTPILESKGDLDIEFSLERSRGAFFDTEWNLPSKIKNEEKSEKKDGTGGPVYDEKITAAQSLQFVLKAVQDSWMSLSLDGVAQKPFLLSSGSSREFSVTKALTLTTVGNAGGVQISVNGLSLKSLGKSGAVVRNLVFDKKTLSQYIDDSVVPSETVVAEPVIEKETPGEKEPLKAETKTELTPSDNPKTDNSNKSDEVVTTPAPSEPTEVTDEDEINKVRINADGKRLILRLVTAQEPPVFLHVAETVRKQWLEAGAKVVIETYPLADLQKKIQERDYDILLFGQNLGYNLDAFPFWHSSQSGEGLNLSNYKSLEADNLLVSIRDTFDERTKDQLLNKLKKVIAEDTPAIFLYNPVQYYAADKLIKNIQLDHLSNHSDRLIDIVNWYVKEGYQLKEEFSFGLLFRWIFGL